MAITQYSLEKLQYFPLHPVAQETGTFTGSGGNIADLNTYEGDMQILLDSGAAAASGTMTGVIQDSPDGSTDWQPVSGGAFTAVAQAASRQVLTINTDNIRRFIRFVGTIAASGTTTYSVVGCALTKY